MPPDLRLGHRLNVVGGGGLALRHWLVNRPRPATRNRSTISLSRVPPIRPSSILSGGHSRWAIEDCFQTAQNEAGSTTC